MEDGAKFWLLSGYSGAGNDIVLTKVDADGTLTAQAALRTRRESLVPVCRNPARCLLRRL